MRTREEIALAVLPAIYAESLNHEMDPHAIASDAFGIADAFIKVRDSAQSEESVNSIAVDWDGVDAECGFTAKFVAMDASGEWWAYPSEPSRLYAVWRSFDDKETKINNAIKCTHHVDWRDSLMGRPK